MEKAGKTDRTLAVSLKNLVFQVYAPAPSLELEVYMEDVVGIMTNYGDSQIEITTKGKEDAPRLYEFASREQMQRFVQVFAKAKALAENAERPAKSCKHVARSSWLREATVPELSKQMAAMVKKATVFKALITGIELCPYKYLIVPKTDIKLVITSRTLKTEETISFSDIVSVSMRYSSFTPTLVTCRRKVYMQTFAVVLPSMRDSIWLRSLFYSVRSPQLLLSPCDKTLKALPLPVFLLTFNMNRQVFQPPVEVLFQRAKDCKVSIVCLQEVPLLKRSVVLKSVEKYFEEHGLVLVCSLAMWEMALFVFVSKELSGYVTRVEKRELTAGFLNIVGNKGGLLVAFELMDTRLAVLGVHLKHGQKNVKERDNTLWKLFRSMRFGFDAVDTQLQADHCFLLGDTNYRIDHDFARLVQETEKNNLQYLLKLDQLTCEKAAGRILSGFQVLLFPSKKPCRRATSNSDQRTSSQRRRTNTQAAPRSVPATPTASFTARPPACRARSWTTPATRAFSAGIFPARSLH